MGSTPRTPRSGPGPKRRRGSDRPSCGSTTSTRTAPIPPPARYRDLFVGDALFAAELRVIPTEYEVPEGWPQNRVLGAIPVYQQIGDEERVAWYISQYDAEIRYMDDALGEVLDFLRAQGLYEGSGIVFTSDHGESLGEHDYFFVKRPRFSWTRI